MKCPSGILGEMDSCPLCSVDLMGLRLEVLLSFLPTIYSTINKYDPAPVEIFTLCPHILLYSICGICTDSYICTKTPTAWLIVAHLLATYHPWTPLLQAHWEAMKVTPISIMLSGFNPCDWWDPNALSHITTPLHTLQTNNSKSYISPLPPQKKTDNIHPWCPTNKQTKRITHLFGMTKVSFSVVACASRKLRSNNLSPIFMDISTVEEP